MRPHARLLAVSLVLLTACASTAPPASVPTEPTTSTTSTSAAISTTSTTPTTPTTSTTATTVALPAFTWASKWLDQSTRALITGRTWQPGCPVSLDGLRLVDLTYWGFDAFPHMGQLVVNADSVAPVVAAFRALYKARFPIRQMRLVDYYDGDDERSMAADNTSAFNCRLVPGSSTWSQHALGRAVDVNPLENPEIRNGRVDPPSASPWSDRSRSDPGMVHHGSPAWNAFAAQGWKWGGDWISLKDYMHFSANGL